MVGFGLVVLAIFSQSYAGRVNLVRDLRRSCEETALRLVNDANNGTAYLSPCRCDNAFPWPSPVEFFR